MNERKIITRMPPSPTGHLHIGTVRTALFNYLFAKKNGGEMILRIEDTDKERSKPEFENEIIDGLSWLGLQWSNQTIYRQSERTGIYKKYLEAGIESGSFYLSQEDSKKNPGETVEVVRLKNPNIDITFEDLVRGPVTFNTTELGDIVIARSIDEPLYHLTVVIDDEEMSVSHVLRGEDHISNTPRQILIQEALGFKKPAYAHLPLILAPDKSKLSKRHGAVSLNEYREEGFLPAALLNYLALLGWNPGTDQEIFSLEELTSEFSIEKVQKSGAIFDRLKLLAINKAHLNKLDEKKFLSLVEKNLSTKTKALSEYSTERLVKLIPSIRERVNVSIEIRQADKDGEYDFAFSEPEPDMALLKWKNDDSVLEALPRLKKAKDLLSAVEFESPEAIKTILWPYAEEVGKGELLWPLRVALTGLERSPDPFTAAFIIGKESTLNRIKRACDKISQ